MNQKVTVGGLTVLVLTGILLTGRAYSGGNNGRKAATAEFEALMEMVAQAWNTGDARKAAACYTEDAVYVEPPDKQVYVGQEALYGFFGGDKKPDTPMQMQWHHLAFNEREQVGFGEYTFQMNNRYHGIVVVRLRDGKLRSSKPNMQRM